MLTKVDGIESPKPEWQTADDPAFRSAIGSYLTGITVVTALDAGRTVGMAANSLTSVTMDPPTLLVCLHKAAATRHAINDTGRFVVNILSADQANVVQSFARRHAEGDKLTGIDHEIIPGYGAAIDGAMASFVCDVSESVLHGTHQVVFGRVERVLQHDAMPMAYFRGKFDALHLLAESTLQRLAS